MNAPLNLAVRCCLSLVVLALCCAPAIASDTTLVHGNMDDQLNGLLSAMDNMGKLLGSLVLAGGIGLGIVKRSIAVVLSGMAMYAATAVLPGLLVVPMADVEHSNPCPTGQYRDGSSCRQQEVVAACPAGWLLSEHTGSCTRAVEAITAAPAEPDASPRTIDSATVRAQDSDAVDERPIVLPVLALLLMALWIVMSANYHARRPTLFAT